MKVKKKIFFTIIILLILSGAAVFVIKWAKEKNRICDDMCGDDICQRIVCLGTSCPCPETNDNCPEDCE